MLFDPSPLLSGLPRGVVVHVGGGSGEEGQLYRSWGSRVFWVEPRPEGASAIRSRWPGDVVLEAAAGSAGGRGRLLLSSNGVSSSLLEPSGHLIEYPSVSFRGHLEVDVVPLDCVVPFADGLVVDAQGYELEVLRGAVRLLRGLSWVYLEVFREGLYLGCPLVEDLDGFLGGFRRVETSWVGSWGDALWVRR